MFVKPPLILVVAVTLIALLFLYNAYLAWFRSEELRQQSRRGSRILPSWFWGRNLWQQKSAPLLAKVMNTFLAFVVLVVTVMVVYAYFVGK